MAMMDQDEFEALQELLDYTRGDEQDDYEQMCCETDYLLCGEEERRRLESHHIFSKIVLLDKYIQRMVEENGL